MTGGICGSGSKESTVAQQVTKSDYALIFCLKHYYHSSNSTVEKMSHSDFDFVSPWSIFLTY